MAIVIIPNMAGMFNENPIFFEKLAPIKTQRHYGKLEAVSLQTDVVG
jgi:hypothetical protein